MIGKIAQIKKNRKKILGLNERHLEYIRPNNLSVAIKIADDKILTKKVLQKADIPVPKLVGVLKNKADINAIKIESLPKSFVIKPVHGVRGGGVEIFYNRDTEGKFIRGNGSRASLDYIRDHCQDIIDGKYSLNNEADFALIEERIKPHKIFRYHTYKGTPDVRVIVYNKIPVMAMLRMPTEQSKGKANLDLGAIGAGIDMAVGKTTSAVIGKGQYIERVPHTNLPISGLKIPFWDKILRYAVEACEAANLGFGAVDILIDKEDGPVIVELNARAGLSIQIANQTGLRERLRKASGIKIKTNKQAIRLAKDLFGGEIEEEIETLSGKQVIGLIQNVELQNPESKQTLIQKAKVDTGADRTSIDEAVLMKIGYEDAIEYFNSFGYGRYATFDEAKQVSSERTRLIASGAIEKHTAIKSRVIVKSSSGFTIRPILSINLVISGITFETHVTAAKRRKLAYKVIIGKKDLKNFLIDPSKKM